MFLIHIVLPEPFVFLDFILITRKACRYGRHLYLNEIAWALQGTSPVCFTFGAGLLFRMGVVVFRKIRYFILWHLREENKADPFKSK